VAGDAAWAVAGAVAGDMAWAVAKDAKEVKFREMFCDILEVKE
jgi:hypothetical protein